MASVDDNINLSINVKNPFAAYGHATEKMRQKTQK